MSWTLVVPYCHRSGIRRSPFCSVDSSGGMSAGTVVALDLTGFDFGLLMAQPVNMRGSSNTWEGVKIFRPGLWPRHEAHCYALWQGRPAYSQGHIKQKMWCCSLHSNEGGLGDLVHIVGRGHLAIHEHPNLSLLPWTAAQSAMPLSFSLVAVDVRLGPGTR